MMEWAPKTSFTNLQGVVFESILQAITKMIANIRY